MSDESSPQAITFAFSVVDGRMFWSKFLEEDGGLITVDSGERGIDCPDIFFACVTRAELPSDTEIRAAASDPTTIVDLCQREWANDKISYVREFTREYEKTLNDRRKA